MSRPWSTILLGLASTPVLTVHAWTVFQYLSLSITNDGPLSFSKIFSVSVDGVVDYIGCDGSVLVNDVVAVDFVYSIFLLDCVTVAFLNL